MVSTQAMTITGEWVQLTDGTQTKSLQVLSGVIMLVDADSQPTQETKGHVLAAWVKITPPTKAWVRATAGDSAFIAVS